MNRFSSALAMIWRQPGYVGLLSANFVQGMAYSFVVPFMSKWGLEYIGMSPGFFGLFMTVTTLSAIVLSTLLARWSDAHVPRRTMLLIGGTGGAIGYGGYAFVSDPWILMLFGALFLSLASVTFSQIFAHLREELARPENSHADATLLTSVARVSFSLAWIVGPAVGAWVKVHFDYQGSFLGAAGLFILFILGILIYVPQRAHPPIAYQPARESLFVVLTRRDILLSFLGFMLYFAAHSMGVMNLPLLVTGELGGSDADVGIIYGIAPIVEIPLMIWSSRMAARGHMMALLRFAALAGAFYFCALPFVQAPWHIYPMQILSAIAIGILTNITITFFQDRLPGQAGIAGSIFSNSFNVGNLVGYFTFSQLLLPLGQRGLFWVCAGFSLITVLVLLGIRHDTPPARAGATPSFGH